jgi:hypothetical protein
MNVRFGWHKLRLRRSLAVVVHCAILVVFFKAAAGSQSDSAYIRVQISFTSPAFVGMPVWVLVDTPSPNKIHYPASTVPADFGCNTLEIKFDGHVLVPEEHASPAARSGPACGWVSAPNSPRSRLPLHIEYALARPGTYLVRYTRYGVGIENGNIIKRILEQSDWTPLQMRSALRSAVHSWVWSSLVNLPSSPGTLVGDALPSLLAERSRNVFRAMLQATYNPDEIVSGYASNTIPMFARAMVRAEMLDIVRKRGPNEALAYAFSLYGDILSPISSEIASISVEYLRSSEGAQVESAVHMLCVLRQPYYGLKTSALPKLDSSVEAAVEVVIAQRNDKAASWIAQYLAISKASTARDALWRLADAHLASEQTLICISWLHNPADLPKIAMIVKTYDAADPYGYKNSGIVGDLRHGYGDAVRPYLRDILRSSRQVWVRVAAAKELLLMHDSAGYQFFLETLDRHPFYHDELVRWLQYVFPTMRKADEAAVTKFLQSQTQSE